MAFSENCWVEAVHGSGCDTDQQRHRQRHQHLPMSRSGRKVHRRHPGQAQTFQELHNRQFDDLEAERRTLLRHATARQATRSCA